MGKSCKYKLKNIHSNSCTFTALMCLCLCFSHILNRGVLCQQVPDNNSFNFEVANHLLPDFEDSYGVVFRSLNGYDRPDIYVVRFRNLNRFFINQGDNVPFLDWTIQSGLGGNLMPRGRQNLELGASAADYDNDGLPDMAIAGWGESTRIFHQLRDARFQDVTEHSGITLPIDGNGAFWADVNLDGYLDLFITDEHHSNRLFLGNSRGKFRDVSHLWGLSDESVSQGAALGDLDGDGYPDLYVCNWFSPDILYRNTGRNFFQRMQLSMKHTNLAANSNGVSFGDIDNDGHADILVTDRDGQSSLYRNQIESGDSLWQFRELDDSCGLNLPYPAYGSVIADVNNDGWQDIWVSSIGPNMLFLNQGNLTFQKVYEDRYHPNGPLKYYSTGAACADMDDDGDLDLFVSNKDTISLLYRNTLNNKNFIQIKAVGVQSNRDAINTRIWLYQKATGTENLFLAGYREVTSSCGYLSQNDIVVHFGVAGGAAWSARIIFPSGIEQKLDNLQKGNRYVVFEHTGVLKAYFKTTGYIHRITGTSYFWLSLGLYLILILSVIMYVYFSTRRYHWATRHIILFFSLTILLLYGIFIAFQEYAVHIRLFTQILVLYGFLLLLTFFMEKIRRLEISRGNYRKLLKKFSQELIFIKDNIELFRKLLATVTNAVHPLFCATYIKEDNILRLLESTGQYAGPEKIELTDLTNNEAGLEENYYQDKIPQPDSSHPNRIFLIKRDYELFGLLVLGRPEHYKEYSTEDIGVFRSLTAQAAIAIENNMYIEKTKQLIKQITESQTREKYLKQLEQTNQKLKKSNRELQKLYQNLKDTQTQLVQSEKMASLGQLVAGVAHELNNPISYIYANMKELENYTLAISELITILKDIGPAYDKNQLAGQLLKLKDKYDFDFMQSDIQSLIHENIEGSHRVKDVVQNLRNFSRLDEAVLKKVDIREGLESTLLLLSNELKNRIEVHKQYGDIPAIYCQPGNINQVFMNILLNAIQAIDDKGNIWVSTEVKDNYVQVTISDDGKGIPKKFQQKIFDPFFTTKPVGRGTGLGLSISYKIISEHKGKIEFTSSQGKGTTFVILLPISNDKK